ncbi:hypothetical protein BRM1_09385 [Brevibacterium sp. BRM-1]|nr:hypothetical protein [Brevibacterium sp. BRM-1]WAL39490.1 hypothetical protein BRM1_09385 [Brevibacterium sp. BRM-1]
MGRPVISTEEPLAGFRGRRLRKPDGRHRPTSLAVMMSSETA